MNFANIRKAILSAWDVTREDFVPLHEPTFAGNEWNYVKDCLDTGWVSSVGKYVDSFEENLKKFTHSKFAVATVNGTAALHVCLILSGIEAEDEVLLPALTFVATANAVMYANAIPHFIDVSKETLGVCPEKLESYLKEILSVSNGVARNKNTNRRVKGLIAMHTFGHPVEVDEIMKICENYHIELIEDAAESLGSYYKERHTGTFSKLSAVSFNGNKVITTGGGGAILTQDEDLAKLAKHLTTTAKIPHKWEFDHDFVGYNYRMPNLNAALGCAQFEALPEYLSRKKKLAYRSILNFENNDDVRIFKQPKDSHSNYWLNTLVIQNSTIQIRNEILENLNQNGIMARPVWKLLSDLKMYKNFPKMNMDNSKELDLSLINIPSSPNLIRQA